MQWHKSHIVCERKKSLIKYIASLILCVSGSRHSPQFLMFFMHSLQVRWPFWHCCRCTPSLGILRQILHSPNKLIKDKYM